MSTRTNKIERRRHKGDWLRWRKFSRDLTRTDTVTVTAIKPDPRSSLAAYCRWNRQELPTISLRVGLTVHTTPEKSR